MIVDLPDTTTNDVNKKITGLREEGGALTLSRVLTLVIAPHTEDLVEESIEAANFASREHPCRVIVVAPGDRDAETPRLDALLRGGHDAGAGEVDLATARSLQTALVRAADAGGDIEVDLFGVSFMDSQGLAAMIVGRQAVRPGRTFTVVDCSRAVERLLDITALAESFGLTSAASAG